MKTPSGSDPLLDWITAHGLALYKPARVDELGRTIYPLQACPFVTDHVGGSAVFFRMPTGATGFRCMHDTCRGRAWKEVVALWGDRPGKGSSTKDPISQVSQISQEGEAEWAEITPLDSERALPPFPVTVLPEWLRTYVEQLAVATQVPVDLPALLVLAVVAVAIQKIFAVSVRAGWIEPLCLYLMVVLGPANRKSSVFSAVTNPIVTWERAQRERLGPEIEAASARKAVAEARAKNAIAKGSRTSTKRSKGPPSGETASELDPQEAEAVRLAAEAAAIKVPVAPRLFADDVTPEKLGGLLAQHGGRFSVLSAEGGLIGIILGRYSESKGPNLELLLKAHAGDASRVDRQTREGESIDYPALTLGMTLQPAAIQGLLRAPGLRGRGLLARWIYALPVSLVGRRLISPPPVEVKVELRYRALVTALLNFAPAELEGEIQTATIGLAPDARTRLEKFAGEVEPELGAAGSLSEIADWGGKLVGAVVRVAGLLHAADHAQDKSRIALPIPASTVERAILVGRWAIPHARAAYMAMGEEDPDLDAARAVVAWLQATTATTTSKSKIHQKFRSTFKTAEDVDPVLEILIAHNYVRRSSEDGTRGRGRPRESYDVNPALFVKASPTPPPEKTEKPKNPAAEAAKTEPATNTQVSQISQETSPPALAFAAVVEGLIRDGLDPANPFGAAEADEGVDDRDYS